jgi:hypothetical protein
MDICMVCYDFDIDDKFFCCNMCLLDIYDYSICNKDIKLMEVIKHLHDKNIYSFKTEIKNRK